MADRQLSIIVFCGDLSRLGRAVLTAAWAQPHRVRAVVVPTSGRWTRFAAALSGGERAPVQRSAPSRLDPVRRLLARLRRLAPARDPLDIAWGLPDPAEIPALCRRRGAELLSVDDVNAPSVAARIAAVGGDLALAGAYPQLFRSPLLWAVRPAVNIHPSLLPRFRGANPVYWTLAAGEACGGVTAHVMVPELDAGPILAQVPVPIAPEDAYYDLYGKLVRATPAAVGAAVGAIARGEAGLPQDESAATRYREPRPADRRLAWDRSEARALHARVRAGGAFTCLREELVGVERTRLAPEVAAGPGERGCVVRLGPDGPEVAATGGRLVLTHVLFRGVSLDGPAFAAAAGLRPGERLG